MYIEINLGIVCLVGNKSDLPNWEVTEEEAKIFAKNNNLHFEVVSTKTGSRVKRFFDFIIYLSVIEYGEYHLKQPKDNFFDKEEETFGFSKDDENKKVYCEVCRTIPAIKLSGRQDLNIDVKCGCGVRRNISVEEYIESLPSIDSLKVIKSCYNHPNEVGTKFCSYCKEFLCDECLRHHNGLHNLIRKYEKIDSLEKCDFHIYRKASYYSKEKHEYKCLICFISLKKEIFMRKHPTTKSIDDNFLKEIYDKIKYKANESIRNLINKYKITKEKKNLIKISKIQEKCESAKNYSYFEKLINILHFMDENYIINDNNFAQNLEFCEMLALKASIEKSEFDSFTKDL